jgi:predicted nucleic acid-binding protein
MQRVDEKDIYISVFSMGEILKGIHTVKDELKRTTLTNWYHNELQERFKKKIIPVNMKIIETWSNLISHHKRTLPFIDSLLAATCLQKHYVLLTRNERDFAGIPNLQIVNPWNA